MRRSRLLGMFGEVILHADPTRRDGMRPSALQVYFSTPNLYTVTWLYVSPGFRSVEGYSERLGESG